MEMFWNNYSQINSAHQGVSFIYSARGYKAEKVGNGCFKAWKKCLMIYLLCVAAAAAWAAALPLVCQVDLFPADVKLPVKAADDEVVDLSHLLFVSLRLEQLLLEAANVRRGVLLFVTLFVTLFVDASHPLLSVEWRFIRHGRDDEHAIWCAANLIQKKIVLKQLIRISFSKFHWQFDHCMWQLRVSCDVVSNINLES